MGYACPVCEIPHQDATHLANHLAFTAMTHGDDHEAWLDDHPDPAAGRVHGTLDPHVGRVQAVYGDVPPAESETLVRAAREIASGLTNGDEAALATARERLAGLQ